ncbi:putative tyrosinase-like protein tyr-3 isoform X2 [Argopecten irradians]|uniref:putative tyrosinase-like protein tyr-3 isoform X1 n=1 Tax=Argopecten irradians TaxID=31199 RepID=UPI0037125A27
MAITMVLLGIMAVLFIPMMYGSEVESLDKVPLHNKETDTPTSLNLKNTISKLLNARAATDQNVKQEDPNMWKRNRDPNSRCFDNDANCERWADNGECRNNPSYMLDECKSSCDICGCYNYNIRCREWQQQGECVANPGYMLKTCRHACGSCRT